MARKLPQPPTAPTRRKPEPKSARLADQRHLDVLLDEAIEESFPASDPKAIDIESPRQ